ncbi:Multidrug resistance protein MdtA [subsurface metagenome]
MKSYKTKRMKKAIIVFAVILSACTASTDNNVNDLIAKRDSLQKAQLEISKELNQIDHEIAILDSSRNADDLKIIKKITAQKNRIASIQLQIKKLEGKMTPEVKDNLTPVVVKQVKGEEFNHYIIVYGNVAAKNYALISPEMNGRIEEIYVNEGQQVSKGKLLLSLNTDAIEKQIEGTKSSLDLATITFEKQEALWKQGIGSEIQYLGAKNQKETLETQIEALEAQRRMAQIRAPFSGIVDKIFSKKGEIASPMMPVVEFVNLDRMIVKADVSESYIGKVKAGQIVELTFASLPDVKIETPIIRVSKVIDSKSRTFQIELNVNNHKQLMRPNMISTIRIKDFSSEDAFVVPSLVIRKDISGNYVYIVQEKEEQQIVEKRYVKTSLSYDDKTMISNGLNENDRVVVEGYHLVSTGVPVKISE